MRVLLAGGGTAGHINPALAIASYIKEQEPDTEFLFIGNKGGMEETLVTKAGFPIKTVVISGFYRGFKVSDIAHNVKTVQRSFVSKHKAKNIIKEFNPDICIGTGGYVSGPVLLAATRMGIPSVIHEQNAFPGITNKMLAKNADVVMLAIEDAKKHFTQKAKFAVTGNPIRPQILTADKEQSRKELNLDERPVILSFGGSLGAKCINESMAKLIARSAKDGKYQHIHAYGQGAKDFPDMLKSLGVDTKSCDNLDIRPFIDDMPRCMAACDLVVSRAGAITLSEVQAMGKPCVLIPSPYVAENHQYHNAMSMVNKKAASIIEEKDLNGDVLSKAVDDLVLDKAVLKEYSKNAENMAITDANERIYKIIKDLLKK